MMELTESNGITHRKNQAGRESVSSIIENSAQSTSLLNESARKGVRVVHSIDPDSCDFEPLMQSINGAALTDLQNIDLSGSEERYNSYSYNHRYASSFSDVEGSDENDSASDELDRDQHHDHPSNMSTSIKQVMFTLINMLPLSTQSLEKLQEMQSQLFSAQQHFYSPIKTDSDTDTVNEKSKASAAFICLIFVVIIAVSGSISTAISHLTGIGPERKIAEVSQSFFYKHNKLSPQGKGLAPPIGTILQRNFDVFADIDDVPLELLDTPLFWHIPRSAGTSMKNIFSSCLGKVLATEVGGLDEHRLDDRILTVKKPNGLFVNVDLYTIEGIDRAKNLGFVQSNLAEVGFTPFVNESSMLFDQNHRGRIFTIMRNPVERIISLYYFLRLMDQKVKNQSLDEFISTFGENWMVRTITGSTVGPIDESHLNAAKEVLRRKVLIGLLDEKTESFRRFEEFLGFNLPSPLSDSCKNSILYFNWHVKNPHPMPDNSDPILAKIQKANSLDFQLYEYSKQLFQEQAVLFSPSKQRMDY